MNKPRLNMVPHFVMTCGVIFPTLGSGLAVSQENMGITSCASWEKVTQDGSRLVLEQTKMADGRYDLAFTITKAGQASRTTRISFGGSTESGCHFLAAEVLPGGDWGWHVAWSSNQKSGVYFARVDAAAWVSSLPKRMASEPSKYLSLHANGSALKVQFGNDPNPEKQLEAHSSDEGRTWELP